LIIVAVAAAHPDFKASDHQLDQKPSFLSFFFCCTITLLMQTAAGGGAD
jgi:hypothetical protein